VALRPKAPSLGAAEQATKRPTFIILLCLTPQTILFVKGKALALEGLTHCVPTLSFDKRFNQGFFLETIA
jgi:hypothetical protein